MQSAKRVVPRVPGKRSKPAPFLRDGRPGDEAPKRVRDALSGGSVDETVRRLGRATRRQGTEFGAEVSPLSGRVKRMVRGDEDSFQFAPSRRQRRAMELMTSDNPEVAERARQLAFEGKVGRMGMSGPKSVLVHNHPEKLKGIGYRASHSGPDVMEAYRRPDSRVVSLARTKEGPRTRVVRLRHDAPTKARRGLGEDEVGQIRRGTNAGRLGGIGEAYDAEVAAGKLTLPENRRSFLAAVKDQEGKSFRRRLREVREGGPVIPPLAAGMKSWGKARATRGQVSYDDAMRREFATRRPMGWSRSETLMKSDVRFRDERYDDIEARRRRFQSVPKAGYKLASGDLLGLVDAGKVLSPDKSRGVVRAESVKPNRHRALAAVGVRERSGIAPGHAKRGEHDAKYRVVARSEKEKREDRVSNAARVGVPGAVVTGGLVALARKERPSAEGDGIRSDIARGSERMRETKSARVRLAGRGAGVVARHPGKLAAAAGVVTAAGGVAGWSRKPDDRKIVFKALPKGPFPKKSFGQGIAMPKGLLDSKLPRHTPSAESRRLARQSRMAERMKRGESLPKVD